MRSSHFIQQNKHNLWWAHPQDNLIWTILPWIPSWVKLTIKTNHDGNQNSLKNFVAFETCLSRSYSKIVNTSCNLKIQCVQGASRNVAIQSSQSVFFNCLFSPSLKYYLYDTLHSCMYLIPLGALEPVPSLNSFISPTLLYL